MQMSLVELTVQDIITVFILPLGKFVVGTKASQRICSYKHTLLQNKNLKKKIVTVGKFYFGHFIIIIIIIIVIVIAVVVVVVIIIINTTNTIIISIIIIIVVVDVVDIAFTKSISVM